MIDRDNKVVLHWELQEAPESVLQAYSDSGAQLPDIEPGDVLRLADQLKQGERLEGWCGTQRLASFMLYEACELGFPEDVVRSCAWAVLHLAAQEPEPIALMLEAVEWSLGLFSAGELGLVGYYACSRVAEQLAFQKKKGRPLAQRSTTTVLPAWRRRSVGALTMSGVGSVLPPWRPPDGRWSSVGMQRPGRDESRTPLACWRLAEAPAHKAP